jgi:hypothetical protein
MNTNSNMNITQVMHMTMQKRKHLLQRVGYRNQWKQVSLKAPTTCLNWSILIGLRSFLLNLNWPIKELFWKNTKKEFYH